jgi:pimeloyl-ACP methyl ester carboxylesterase
MRAHEQRIGSGSHLLDTASGTVEVAEAGKIDDPPLLVIHGSGGGFDQGLTLGSDYAARSYRVIAPSRFGLVIRLPPCGFFDRRGRMVGGRFPPRSAMMTVTASEVRAAIGG